jgi:prolipoprotein diacylglyceryltransferase
VSFPVVFHPFGLNLPAHLVFESLAYLLGFRLFLILRRRSSHGALPFEQTAWLLVGAVFGAFFGSKLLAWAEHPHHYWSHRHEIAAWMGGKTIVGGLLGGWAGVEIAKAVLRIRSRTGDLYALPLLVGIAVGRVGCFLTGLPDQTHGVATSLPWGVDFGDGIPRHPTQLYEIAFAIVMALVILRIRRLALPAGSLFRIFLGGYLLFRFAVEWIKPSPKDYGGLSAIQIASLAGAIACIYQLITARSSAAPSPLPSSASA